MSQQEFISELHIWAGGLTAQDFYTIGVAIGGVLTTIGVVAWIKRSYLKANARKLASEFIVLNVAFWSFLSSIAGFIILQGAQYAHLLPYLEKYWPTIMSAAIATHAVATGFQKFWADRKAGKSILDTNVDGIVDQKPVEALKPIPRVTSDVWTRP